MTLTENPLNLFARSHSEEETCLNNSYTPLGHARVISDEEKEARPAQIPATKSTLST